MGQLLAEEEVSGIGVFIPAFADWFWSLIITAILAFFFFKYLMPKMTQVLDERAEKIEGGIERAAVLQAEAEASRGEREAELASARQEASRIRDAANVEGEEIVAQARRRAQEETDRILEGAQRQIEAERTAAVVSLRTDIGSLATELAGRIVGESLADDARQSRIVDRFLDELDTTTVGATEAPGRAPIAAPASREP